jgi:predicted membrane chloride channel (bestrophin family)
MRGMFRPQCQISLADDISRYGDGRKAWTALILQSRIMARAIWIHVEEREGEEGKEDLLSKVYVPACISF